MKKVFVICIWLSLVIAGFQPVIFSAKGSQTIPLRGYLTAHDPSRIIQCKNRYYLFYTGQGIASKSSSNRVFWSPGPAVFSSPPAWTTNLVPGFAGIFWAPDILHFNNQYYLYYAVSTFGSQVSAIGLATNPTLDPTDPAYHWTDRGPVISSTNGSVYNTIDPSFSWDNSGNLWMAFGSYWNGIYLTQLNPATGLRISPDSPTYHLAWNSSIEASYLCRRGGYYYLFVNWGSCCSGVNSTYNIRVGRSTNITGPYLDQNGVDMVNGGGTLFMQGTGKFVGPGQVGILSTNGAQWFSYHYYDANAWAPQYNAYGAPEFNLVPLSWTADDWPVFTNDWSAIYNFQGDASDENGQYSGLLEGGATIQPDPVYGHVLNLNGTNQYVWLPPGAAYGQTFVAVVKWRGGGAWQRIFDFGYDTTRTVMLTPSSGDGVLRCDINPGGSLQTVQWTKPLPTNVWTQVAVTLNGSAGTLYVNGLPVVTNTSMNYMPLDVAPQTNALGKSKFTADPYFNGQYASFRVYGRALTATEIAAPLPTISQPADGATYMPGEVVNYAGSATDFASRPLTAGQLTWQILYVQDGRTNVVAGPITGATNGTFAIPTNATGGGNYMIELTATDDENRNSTVSSILCPAHPPHGWSSYYPLRSNANDANGHFNGVLHGGASFVDDPQRGNVLSLSGNSQFVSFPPGLSDMQTFMAWVKWRGGAAWQRIYDFGDDTNRYSVLTPEAANGKLRFNISVDSIPGEQVVDAPFTLPSNVWVHVAVVMNGNSVVLYTNGVSVATNLYADLVPADLNATNIYIGKSQWPADPYFSGEISSVRVFSRTLTPGEIIAPQITIAQPAQGGVYAPGSTISFSGGADDFYDNPIPASGLTWTVNFINAGVTNKVFGSTSGIAGGTFAIPATGVAATNGFYQVVLVAVDSAGRAATNSACIFPLPTTTSSGWSSLYPFTNGFQDANGLYDATPKNGASIQSDPVRGNVLNLAGIADQYVNLPPDAGAAQTISGWVKWSGGASWQRIFDFGVNDNQFFYFTPSDGNGLPQVAITPDLSVYNQVLESPESFPINQWTHVAVVMNGREGILYINGQEVAVNDSVNLLPSDIGATNCNFGKSQFSADPYFNGRLSDMELNSAALPVGQIIGPSAAITRPAPGTLFAGGQTVDFAGTGSDYSGSPLPPASLTWSIEFHSNDVTYVALGPVTGITNGTFTVPVNGPISTNLFYHISLTATDTNGYQQTTYLDLPPQTSTLHFDTIPSGLQLNLDGSTFNTPSNMTLVAGYNRMISAPATQNFLGTNYNFVLWSDGGNISHSILVPTNNSSLVASYILPNVTIGAAATNVTFSWPAWAASMSLYSATNLTPPINWVLVTNTATLSNGAETIQLPSTGQSMFFILKSP
jgi:Glycosyl hydrolases family 43/Concanavalin A-like lectin/glucanases superfamily